MDFLRNRKTNPLKIKYYFIIHVREPDEPVEIWRKLADEVQSSINEGCEPIGEPVMTHKGMCQAMIQYEKE
ncbi:MAG: hypothetical protein O2960_02655 [Verrucomicrobia bacterium]|nr:hypothetical protein [Verrucomicrobiota bacterium]